MLIWAVMLIPVPSAGTDSLENKKRLAGRESIVDVPAIEGIAPASLERLGLINSSVDFDRHILFSLTCHYSIIGNLFRFVKRN